MSIVLKVVQNNNEYPTNFWRNFNDTCIDDDRPLVENKTLDLKNRLMRFAPYCQRYSHIHTCDTQLREVIPQQIEKLGYKFTDFDEVDLSWNRLHEDDVEFIHEMLMKCKPNVTVYMDDCVKLDPMYNNKNVNTQFKEILEHCGTIIVDIDLLKYLNDHDLPIDKLVTFIE